MSAFPAARNLQRFYLCEALAVLELRGRSPALMDYARHRAGESSICVPLQLGYKT
jgi:hypothetical protein